LGGLAVERVDDLSLGSADLPPTDGLRYSLADGARVIVRPSGTEPKVKCYLEVVVPVEASAGSGTDDSGGVDAARIAAAGRLDAIRADVQKAAGL
jgi:phosphomannomutase